MEESLDQIDWKKELLESQKFNKFQEKLLKDGAKSFMQGHLSWLSLHQMEKVKRIKPQRTNRK